VGRGDVTQDSLGVIPGLIICVNSIARATGDRSFCGASVPGASPVVCVYALELVGGCGGVCRSGGEGGVDAWSWYHCWRERETSYRMI